MEETVGTGIGLFLGIVILVVIGVVIGFVARAILPGKQNIGLFATMLSGIGGSLIAGLIGRFVFEPAWFQIVLSIIGAMVLVALVSRTRSSAS